MQLKGGAEWQKVGLSPSDFRNAAGQTMTDWKGLKELRLQPRAMLVVRTGSTEKRTTIGAAWQGVKPEFRSLRWEKEAIP